MQRVPNTHHYALSPNGFVINTDSGRVLKRYYAADRHSYYSTVENTDGKRVRFYHDADRLEPAADDVSLPEDALPVSGYPNYYVTPYGAVWRSGGGKNHRPRILREVVRFNKAYVQLTNKDGKRTWLSVRKMVLETFDNDAACCA